MTLDSTLSKLIMQGNGATRSWPFPFRAWEGETAVVITDPAGDETDVTAQCDIVFNESTGEGASSPSGGVVTYPRDTEAPALPSGWSLTIFRDMNMLQEMDLYSGQKFGSSG
jgi:hypothetical protein